MKIRRKVEIVIETRQTAVVRSPEGRATQRLCPLCAAVGRMVTPEEAAGVACVTARAVYGLVESGRVHFVETPDGLLLICLNSLAASREGAAEFPTGRQAALPGETEET